MNHNEITYLKNVICQFVGQFRPTFLGGWGGNPKPKQSSHVHTSTITLWPVSPGLFTEQQSGAKNKTVQGYFLNFKMNLLTRLVPP